MNRLWAWTGAGGLLVGLLVGWWWGRPGALPPEPPAPSVLQVDGSLVVERVDPATVPSKAPHAIPARAVEERRVSVVVQPQKGVVRRGSGTYFQDSPLGLGDGSVQQPDGQGASSRTTSARGTRCDSDSGGVLGNEGASPDSCDCPPVQVDLSLVRMPDKTRRVVASSPTGTIISGIDAPLEPAAMPRIPQWTLSAIAVADVDGIRPGALLSRRIGPLVVGGGILSDPGMRRPGVIGQLGVSW